MDQKSVVGLVTGGDDISQFVISGEVVVAALVDGHPCHEFKVGRRLDVARDAVDVPVSDVRFNMKKL